MQSLSSHLSYLIGNKKLFKIKFKQYDYGAHVFYPNYRGFVKKIQNGDILAWFWGNSLKIGIATEPSGKDILTVTLLTRKQIKRKIAILINTKDIACVFQQE